MKKGMKKIWKWRPMSIKGKKFQEFCSWLNNGADFEKYNRCLDSTSTIGNDKKPNHITEFGQGYNQAVGDIYEKLGVDYNGKFAFAVNDGMEDKE